MDVFGTQVVEPIEPNVSWLLPSDTAVRDQHHLLAILRNELRVVFDHDDRLLLFLVQPAEPFVRLAGVLWVKLGGRFVNHHELWIHRQHPRERDEVLLAAAEFPDKPIFQVGETDHLKGARGSLFVVVEPVVQRRELNIVSHCLLDELVFEILEDVAHLPGELPDSRLAGVSAVDTDGPVERSLEKVGDQSVERFTERGFPAAVSADDGGELARIDA